MQPLNTAQGRPTEIPVGQAKLYMLLDGALIDAPRYAYSSDTNPEIEALYRNTRHDAALQISPLLIKPSPVSDFWIQQDQWRENGILIRSEAPMAIVGEHLKSLISVRLPSRQMAYCRFYSPEWLVRFLTSLTQDELSAWSGPIQEWYVYSSQTWIGFQPSATAISRGAGDEGWFSLRHEQIARWQIEEYQRFICRAAALLGGGVDSQETDALREISELVDEAHTHGFILEYQCFHYLELARRFPHRIHCPELQYLLWNQDYSADYRLQQAERLLFSMQEA